MDTFKGRLLRMGRAQDNERIRERIAAARQQAQQQAAAQREREARAQTEREMAVAAGDLTPMLIRYFKIVQRHRKLERATHSFVILYRRSFADCGNLVTDRSGRLWRGSEVPSYRPLPKNRWIRPRRPGTFSLSTRIELQPGFMTSEKERQQVLDFIGDAVARLGEDW